MPQNKTQDKSTRNRYKLIYNPNAGKKRKRLGKPQGVSLEDISELLAQYQLDTDFFPTKKAGHATQLAQEAIDEGYSTVLVAGGDGTVGEVANGLVGSSVVLGILPLGTFMNVARMLSIPQEIEKAVMLIKAGRVRKIDVGCITRMNGENLKVCHYFLEGAGIGIEAEFHQHFVEFENGNYGKIFAFIKKFIHDYRHRATLILDGQEQRVYSSLITVSNGPYTGAALKVAPSAKLNDHRLTINVFRMTPREIFNYFITILRSGKASSRKVTTHQAKEISIETKEARAVHADGRVFGTTPVSFSVLPNALHVITGFPKPEEASLVKRTYLDP